MESYKIYKSLPEKGLYLNTKTNEKILILTKPSVRIINPTNTALNMLEKNEFHSPVFLPCLSEIEEDLPRDIEFDPVENLYTSIVGEKILKSKFLEELQITMENEKKELETKSYKYIFRNMKNWLFKFSFRFSNEPQNVRRFTKSFPTKEEAIQYRNKFFKLNNLEEALEKDRFTIFLSKDNIQYPQISEKFKREKYQNEFGISFDKNQKRYLIFLQTKFLKSFKEKEEAIQYRDKFLELNNLKLIQSKGSRYLLSGKIDWNLAIYPDSKSHSESKSSNESNSLLDKYKEKDLFLTEDGEIFTERELIERAVKSGNYNIIARKIEEPRKMKLSFC